MLQACGLAKGGPVHKGDVDEGLISWEPPAFPGLDNSDGFRDLPKGKGKHFSLQDLENELWSELMTLSEEEWANMREAPVLSDSVVKHLYHDLQQTGKLQTTCSFDVMVQLVNHGYLPYEYAPGVY